MITVMRLKKSRNSSRRPASMSAALLCLAALMLAGPLPAATALETAKPAALCQAPDTSPEIAAKLATVPWSGPEMLYLCPGGSVAWYRLDTTGASTPENDASAGAPHLAPLAPPAPEGAPQALALNLNGDALMDMQLNVKQDGALLWSCLFAGCGGNWFAPLLYLEAPLLEVRDMPPLIEGAPAWKQIITGPDPGNSAGGAAKEAHYLFIDKGYKRQVDSTLRDRVAQYYSNKSESRRNFLLISPSGRVARPASADTFTSFAHIPREGAPSRTVHTIPALPSPFSVFPLPARPIALNTGPFTNYIQPADLCDAQSGGRKFLVAAGVGFGLALEVGQEVLPVDAYAPLESGVPVNGIVWYDLDLTPRLEDAARPETDFAKARKLRFFPESMDYRLSADGEKGEKQ